MIAHESYSVKSYSVKCSFMACKMLMPILWQHIEGWRNYIFARVRCNCKWYFQRDCNTWDLTSWIRNRTLIWRSKTNVFVQWQKLLRISRLTWKMGFEVMNMKKNIIFYGDRHFWESADLLWKSCMPCSAVQTWELTMWDSANNIGNITSSHPDSTRTSSKKISNFEIFLVSWNFPSAKMTGKKCGNKKELNIYGPIILRNIPRETH